MGAPARGPPARQRFARRKLECALPTRSGLKPSPYRLRFNEVRDSPERSTFEVKPHLRRRIVLPLEGKGDRSAVDEVRDSPERSTLEVKPHLRRRIVLPLEGKGDRFAVDEVKMRTVPLSRSANAAQSKSAR